MTRDQEELLELFEALCDGVITPTQHARLEERLSTDAAARQSYFDYLDLRLQLRQWQRASAESPNAGPCTPIVIQTAPVLYAPISGFSTPLGGFVFSYVAAAVIVAVGLLIGWTCQISTPHYEQHAAARHPGPSGVHPEPEIVVVGRITGMADCQWSDPKTEPFNGASVPLGRKYAMAAGLMEITFDSGARVILEGPCVYTVESKSAGYLAIGKLTARVEASKKSGKRSAEENGSPGSKMPERLARFAVRTPTAIVTDLGTEFGVEYDKSGVTRSLVFQGSVTLQAASANGESQGTAQILLENQSARVERTGLITGDGSLQVALGPSVRSRDFIRKMPRQTPKTFDLVDAMAGGDGYSGRRNRGIDPTNGQVVNEPPQKLPLIGDGQYHRIKELPFVDGVFIPRSGSNRVQIDSAGHTFAGFLNSSDETGYYIWGGSPIECPGNPRKLIVTNWGNINYGLPGHGSLFLHANCGITFDLDAIRQANPNHSLTRFRAVAGNTETDFVYQGLPVYADIWVFVDGQVRFQRRKIGGRDGAFHLSIPLGKNDRFLTLVGTDGGNNIVADWITFGDPRLELVAIDSNRSTDSAPKQRSEDGIHQ